MQSFVGKVALICGGTTGIGFATAIELVKLGASVAIAARNAQQGLAAERELKALGGNAIFFPVDVSHPAAVAELLSGVVTHFGRLDCAVNSAASDAQPSAAHEMPHDEAVGIVSTDFLGVFHCMQQEIAAMLKGGGGTIVNVASINGLSGTPTAAVYSAAKHAVIGLTRSAAKEYIAHGIRINAVCPGATDTPRRERRLANLSPEERLEQIEALSQAIPIGRLAKAEEIANAIVWLSSASSSYVVGHSLVVDGGLLA